MCCLVMCVASCCIFTSGNLVMEYVLSIGVVGEIQLPRPHMKYIDGCGNRLTYDVTGADILRGIQLF